MSSINRETPSRRRFYRLTAPIRIEIDGRSFKVADWSMGGFRISNFPGEAEVDSSLTVEISAPFQGYDINFEQKTIVVRSGGSGTDLCCEFVDMDERARGLLEFFSKGLISGELSSIEDVIQRIDTPVTPVSGIEPTAWRDQSIMTKLRRTTALVVYLIAGGVLTAYAFITLYSYFYRLQVETALITAQLQAVYVPESGIVAESAVVLGQMVSKGDPLFTLSNPELDERVRLAEINVMEAEVRLIEKRAKLDDQKIQLVIYTDIGNTRLQSARDEVAAIANRLSLAKQEFERKKALRDRGVMDDIDVDAAASAVAAVNANLVVTQSKMKIARESLAAIDQGLFFTGEQLRNGLPMLEAEVATAEKMIEMAQKRLETIRERLKGLDVMAPVSGRIVEYARSVGNFVEQGDALMTIEEAGSRRLIAYLTQSEVLEVSEGDDVLVYVPSIDMRQSARVVSIDRTIGFSDEINHQYRWRKPEDPTAEVQLSFEDVQIIEEMPTGLPIVVNFERATSNELIARVFDYITSFIGDRFA